MSHSQKAPRRIAIAGASGFIGSALARHLEGLGHAVIRIGRHEDPRHGHIPWDPEAGTMAADGLAGVRIVINLAGENIGQRWTPESRKRIIDSRVRTTDLLARACASMDPRPRVLVNMSAIGFYGDRGDEVLDERSPLGTAGDRGPAFLAKLCQDWEAEARAAEKLGLRVVCSRTGLVLAAHGGALAKMLPPFRLGAGGPLATGRMWMSWISLDDALAGRHVLVVLERTEHARVPDVRIAGLVGGDALEHLLDPAPAQLRADLQVRVAEAAVFHQLQEQLARGPVRELQRRGEEGLEVAEDEIEVGGIALDVEIARAIDAVVVEADEVEVVVHDLVEPSISFTIGSSQPSKPTSRSTSSRRNCSAPVTAGMSAIGGGPRGNGGRHPAARKGHGKPYPRRSAAAKPRQASPA